MSDLTPKESAALRARVLAGAAALPPRRPTAGRIAAVASAVVIVVALGATAASFALNRETTTAVVTPSPSATPTRAAPSPTATASPPPTATATPTPTPTPSETVPPPGATLESGDIVVDSAQWQLVSERGWGTWQMADGRYIATDPALPLPAQVTEEIQRQMDAIPNNTVDQADGDHTTALVATQELMWRVRGTGKQAIMVRYNSMSVPIDPANPARMRWYAQATQSGWWMQVAVERDKLLADIDAWIAANTAPGSWVVFVGPGEPVAPY